jgi:hypothetical protein
LAFFLRSLQGEKFIPMDIFEGRMTVENTYREALENTFIFGFFYHFNSFVTQNRNKGLLMRIIDLLYIKINYSALNSLWFSPLKPNKFDLSNFFYII